MRVILDVDPEEKEVDAFIWTEDYDPPPVIRPKRPKQLKDMPPTKEEKRLKASCSNRRK